MAYLENYTYERKHFGRRLRIFAVPKIRYPNSLINQYEREGDYEKLVSPLYETISRKDKPTRFAHVLTHFSEPSQPRAEISEEVYVGQVIEQWRVYARSWTDDVGRLGFNCICSQCNIHDLRYVVNLQNENVLLVGNSCIKKLPNCTTLWQQNAALSKELNKTLVCGYCETEKAREEFDYKEICKDCERDRSIDELRGVKRYCRGCDDFCNLFENELVCKKCHKNHKHVCVKCSEFFDSSSDPVGAKKLFVLPRKPGDGYICAPCWKKDCCEDCGTYILQSNVVCDRCANKRLEKQEREKRKAVERERLRIEEEEFRLKDEKQRRLNEEGKHECDCGTIFVKGQDHHVLCDDCVRKKYMKPKKQSEVVKCKKCNKDVDTTISKGLLLYCSKECFDKR